MLNNILLVGEINNKCKHYFPNSHFELKSFPKDNPFIYRIEGLSYALNRHKNNSEKIKVLHWFDDFWIFLELKFMGNNTFISLSVFQGNDQDETKHQLFRAEWDDYNNPDEIHPQPHWHITSDYAIEETFKDFSDSFDNGSSFLTFEAVKSEIINIRKIHFAMNGNWQNGESHAHSIDDNIKITKWFQGILNHLKIELEYVK